MILASSIVLVLLLVLASSPRRGIVLLATWWLLSSCLPAIAVETSGGQEEFDARREKYRQELLAAAPAEEKVGQRVTCRGTARNGAFGACVADEASSLLVYLDGVERWEADIPGKHVIVHGRLEKRTVASGKPGGAAQQTIYTLGEHQLGLVDIQCGLQSVEGRTGNNRIGAPISYYGVFRSEGMLGSFVDGRDGWPGSIHLDDRPRLPALGGKQVVVRGVLRLKMIGSDDARTAIPRQALFYMADYQLDPLPHPSGSLDPEGTKAQLEKAMGGKWWTEPGGWLTGRVPVPGTERYVGIRIIPYPYSDPVARDAARHVCYVGRGPFRIAGSSPHCTALLAIPDDSHPLVRQLRELLGLKPVQGPTTCEEFERVGKAATIPKGGEK